MNKKVCISGYYGFDNFGDETILEILVKNLKNLQPDLVINVFSSNPPKTADRLGVNSSQTFNIKEVIKNLQNCNCLISGGGSLLQDSTSKKSLIYYLAVLLIAKFFRKKTIIFAQGIGPIRDKFLRSLTMQVLKRADYITVRDTKSYNLLKEHGINSYICSDPVWNLGKINSARNNKIG
ncbi:polysaccharide pyruvyl transferase family protein, partial [bacterium]|nr:polysaccharide pyruvyl transferase family protein [bacterium]